MYCTVQCACTLHYITLRYITYQCHKINVGSGRNTTTCVFHTHRIFFVNENIFPGLYNVHRLTGLMCTDQPISLSWTVSAGCQIEFLDQRRWIPTLVMSHSNNTRRAPRPGLQAASSQGRLSLKIRLESRIAASGIRFLETWLRFPCEFKGDRKTLLC